MTDAPTSDTDGSSRSFWDRRADSVVGGAAVTALAIGTIVYHLVEQWSWVDSFYFSAIAVTTVGFGDLTPTTDFSKLFTVLYIFSAMTLIGLWLNTRFKRHSVRVSKKSNLPLQEIGPVPANPRDTGN